MLRSLLLATMIGLMGFTASAANYSETTTEEEHIMPAGDDRWVPWPWAMVQPFPWSDIQGLWKVEQGDFTSYFALKVVRQKSTGIRQLQVKQFDGDTCRVLATGVGIERSNKVLAQMTSKLGATYRVQLSAFSEKDLQDLTIPPLKGDMPTEAVMVLSMGALDNKGIEGMVHMQIMKISAHLTQKVCLEDIKK
ncbi:hypothetical protein AZI87_06105 [Bdellovibrio bacteriovorus]|uniref:Uncharacterized protein n=1 Tax=Bdellovibrio bacteriovorus TaxID=959 RepID=A0A162GRQ9_BDEBC|nr:hypothetical protein [Bdellovibrio bacteriovorus]KYG68799.1 hypothetical protein AZI87_06105 [Bdellovibrio bacteriovorus]